MTFLFRKGFFIMKKLKITVIGSGALGKALVYKLKRNGFNVAGVASRKAKKDKYFYKFKIFPLKKAYKNNSDVYILAVPDKAIRKTAKSFAKHFHSKKILIHLSGCLPSDILKINKHCSIASCHPIGSFKNFESSLIFLEKAYWTLEGDKIAIKFMKKVINNLSGKYSIINKQDKPLYHAACTLASSGLLSLIYASYDMLKEIKFSRKINHLEALLPLVASSVENLKLLGFPKGLTGPLARGDKKIIRIHKKALNDYDKSVLKLYKNILTLTQKYVRR